MSERKREINSKPLLQKCQPVPKRMKFNFRISSLMPAHIINCYLITFISAARTHIHTYILYSIRYQVPSISCTGKRSSRSNVKHISACNHTHTHTYAQVHNGFIKYSYWSYSSHNNPSSPPNIILFIHRMYACMYDCMYIYIYIYVWFYICILYICMYDCMYVCM